MAYKILLVDDEMLDLQAMEAFVPWRELGFEVKAAVNSGFHALEVLEREAIDLLVTDIHMPNMTGLELARRALEKQSGLKILFISGHQDFNYVKTAMSLNACSYVLKPIDDEELMATLSSVHTQMNEERRRQETEHVYKEMIPIVQKEYLQQVLEGSRDPKHVSLLLDSPDGKAMKWPLSVAIVEPDDWSWKLNQYTEKEKKSILHAFQHGVAKVCQEQHIHFVCRMANQRMAILLEASKQEVIVLEELLASAQEKFPFTMTGGIGNAVNEPFQLAESYQQASAALDYKMFVGKGKWIAFDKIEGTELQDAENVEIQLDSLFQAIHDELNKLFRATRYLHSRWTIYHFTMFIVLKLEAYLQHLNEDLFKILDIELKNLDILLQFETIDDIHSWLRRRLFEISELLHQKNMNKNSKLIREIIDYVQMHLKENLTLRHISDHFTFSPNYLGLIFKEQTGKNYSEYVVDMRMEKAGELLKNPSMKVYEVADLVGYRYLPYFSRQFKESYGMTPNEFRRLC